MANITVTTLNDELDANPADNGLSLREAIQIANQSAGADTISFADGLTGISRLTLGELQVTDQLSIDGGGKVTISGDSQGNDVVVDGVTDVSASTDGADLLADNSRLFNVTADAVEFCLSGLTLTGGRTTQNVDSGGALTAADGVTVTVSDSQISGNSTTGAGSDGGGLNVEGALIISGSTISGNSTLGSFSDGGGIFAGSITITGSSVVGNSTDGNYANGGGVASAGSVDAIGNFIGLNQTVGFRSPGGGLFAGGVSTLTNNTIYGNLTFSPFSDGAGVFLDDASTLINNTITGNAALQPGAYGGGVAATGNFIAEGNILIGNFASKGINLFGSDDPTAVINFSGPNLIGFAPGDTDLSGDPNVSEADPVDVFDQTAEMNGAVAGVAGENGGPVQTVALDADVSNSALDAGGGFSPAIDARGFAAVDVDGVGADALPGIRDLGAFETYGEPAGPEAGSFVVTTTADVVDAYDGVTSLREAITYANELEGVDTITFAAGGQGLIRLTQGEITITEEVIIDGGGKVTITGDKNGDDITIAGDITDVTASLEGMDRLSDNSRLFKVDGDFYDYEAGAVRFTGLTLTGGRADEARTSGAAVEGSGFDIEISDSVIAGNFDAVLDNAAINGAAVFSYSSLSVTNSVVSGNQSLKAGGALAAVGDVSLTNTTVTGNSSNAETVDFGAAVQTARGEITLTDSIIVGNTESGAAADLFLSLGDVNGENEDIVFLGANIVGQSAAEFDTRGNANVINAEADIIFANVFDNGGIAAGALTGAAGETPTIELRAFSDNPALDASTTSLNVDVVGAPRFVDQIIVDNGGTSDLGAVELQTQAVIVDEPEERSLVVTTTEDIVNPFDGVTSLREAVIFANATSGEDKITFAAGGQGLIRLTEGPIEITDSLEIDGNRKVTITGDANNDDITRVGDITDVDASQIDGAVNLLDDNTGIFVVSTDYYNQGRLILTSLTLTGGRSQSEDYSGGAVSSDYFNIIARNTTFAGNSNAREGAEGGAINATDSGVTLLNSTISGSRTDGSGGAISALFVYLENSTITGNWVSGDEAKGGAFKASVNLGVKITNSIIVGNSTSASDGGEIAGENGALSGDTEFIKLNGTNIIGTSRSDFATAGVDGVINAPAGLIFAQTVDNNGVAAGAISRDASGLAIIPLRDFIFNPALDAASNTFELDAVGAPRSVDQSSIDNGGTGDLGAVELQTQVMRLEPELAPTPGPDLLTGTAAADEITGLRGADTITGLGGADTLDGGGGGDLIAGNGGKDVISGGGGKDTIEGNGGRDIISGGGGKDDLDGGGGKDMVSGNGGRDTVKGGGGKDTLEGGGGKDFLDGGRGRDFLDGSNGNDTLVGGKGNDVLTGGGGLDTFQFTRGDGRDTITDFDQLRDKIEILDGADSFDDLMITQAGADVRIKFANVVITVENDQVENFTAADFMF